MNKPSTIPCRVSVTSEIGRLRAVLLRRPGVEIERMTPLNAQQALYSDILNKPDVDEEYSNFCGVLERWTKVYYVRDVLALLLENDHLRRELVGVSVRHDRKRHADEGEVETLTQRLCQLPPATLAEVLIEGYENPTWDGQSDDRYLLHPLYNLLFTRDASSTLYDRVLINSMRFEVREREAYLYESIFRHFFGVDTLCAERWDSEARTEGGDVQIASPDMLCIGEGIRTNAKGIQYLTQTFARERETFHILVQELPHEPESFIHLDMVFTFLGRHECMCFEPMLRKQGLFSNKDTWLITIDHGRVTHSRVKNIVEGLNTLGWDMIPIISGGKDPWVQLREQWHSGVNFFALDDCRVMGYRRNTHTIEALDRAGYVVLKAEDIINDRVKMSDYKKFVVAFPGSELPRAGGGARCMTMPVWRD